MSYDDVDGEQLVEKKRFDDLLKSYNDLITRHHNLDQDMIFVRAENKELKDALKKITDEQGFKKASEVAEKKPTFQGKSEIEAIELFASTTDDKLITTMGFLMRKHPKKIIATIKGDQITSFGVENL
jgi:predicted RNase H-like nuclease